MSSKERREVILYVKQTQWTSGVWLRRDLALTHRALLVTVLVSARTYKRMRMWMLHHWLDRERSGG